MTRLCHLICACLLAIEVSPAQAAVAQPPAAAKQSIGARLLRVTNEMWFLLSSVVDTASADAAAERFSSLAAESVSMSDQLFDSNSQAIDLEALDQDTYRIAEAYEDLSYEFESLCRARCYGSIPLTKAFVQAMRDGVFSDDCADHLQRSSILLSERDARAEISRLEHLAPQDKELLQILCRVQDSHSADTAAQQLSGFTKKLRKLLPTYRLRLSNFPEKSRPALAAACSRLEPILWMIRNEIVRIVSLPGYDNDAYDTFSDALDSAFESLSDTHSECFDSIFDESFRADLDDALHESVTSSQR